MTLSQILKILWALPGTLVGLVLYALFRNDRAKNTWHFHDGALRWRVSKLIPQWAIAQTWGHLVLLGPGFPHWSPDRYRLVRMFHDHETAHVRQWETWGPLFPLAYGVGWLIGLLAYLPSRRSDDPPGTWMRAAYHRNPFEVAARKAAGEA